jgi:DMSO/TMAO reductase YedYZ molybdopterin-dependent catalytic subunit
MTRAHARPAEGPATRWLLGGLIGLLSATSAIAVGELAAALAAVFGANAPSAPVVAVGEWAIALSPAWLKEAAIRQYGTHDKTALLSGVYLGILAISALAGVIARRHLGLATLVATGFGVTGLIAAATRPSAGFGGYFPALLAGGAAVLVLRGLTVYSQSPDVRGPDPDPVERRRFLAALGGTAVACLVGGFGGQAWLDSRYSAAAARAGVKIPAPAEPLPELPASVHPGVPGLEPFFTPNVAQGGFSGFYRVDTALSIPQVDPNQWSLKIHGMVDRPFEISFDELLRMPLEEHDLTLTCVSNPVGGPYCGNARWLGTQLAPLLRRAGVRSGADQILSTSTDGMTIGSPVEAVLDGRQAMLAVAMNGEALPIEHGFPCRMLIPGLYGYVSATKWVVDLELTTFAQSSAYWVTNGWSQQGPVKTASRIDVPQDGATVNQGTVTLAGVAWATHRGVDAVEVRIDNGPWISATLATSDTPDTWRMWSYAWQAERGSHMVSVRCTDGTGTLQTSAVQGVIPNGATGYHSISVNVA